MGALTDPLFSFSTYTLITSLYGQQLLQRIPADILIAVMFYSASVDLCDLVYSTLHRVGKYA